MSVKRVNLDDPATLRAWILDGRIWDFPQYHQLVFDAVKRGLVTKDEAMSHMPADIKASVLRA